MTEARRRRPSHGRILVRRLVAFCAVAVLLGGGVAAAWIVLKRQRDAAPAPPTITVAPPPKPFRVVFPEGFTREQMAQRVQTVAKIAAGEHRGKPHISKQAYLAATKPRVMPGFGTEKRDLEGFLFPATYDFLAKTTSKQLVQAQLQAFKRNWDSVDLAYAKSKNLTPYDVLIIASMIEREAQVPSERAKVAAVIYNRLHAGMPLGMDSTIRYGLHVPPTEPLHESQLQSDNPYNTRKHTGLPPTPIANPGLAAIQAAAHPAKVDYLYFVRKPDHRHHYFTNDYNDFVNHERAYGY